MSNEKVKDRIIILSGGIDSTVLLHRYRKSINAAFHFQYGQKNCKEGLFAKRSCALLEIPYHIIDIENAGICKKCSVYKKWKQEKEKKKESCK